MNQSLLKDIELDLEQLKCLMDAVSKNYNLMLCEAGKRNILQMSQKLMLLHEEIEDFIIRNNENPSVTIKEEDKAEAAEEEKSPDAIPEKNEDIVLDSDPVRNCIEEVEDYNDTESVENVPIPEVSEETSSNSSTTTSSYVSIVEEHNFVTVSDRMNTSLKQFITLNDKFRFSRELFEGNTELMNQRIEELDRLNSFEEALSYMDEIISADEENEATLDFIELLRKRFNR